MTRLTAETREIEASMLRLTAERDAKQAVGGREGAREGAREQPDA